VLFYHSDCTYSTNFKQKFVSFYNNPNNGSTDIVGIVDCMKEKSLCSIHNVNFYPGIQKIYENLTYVDMEVELFLGSLIPEYKSSD
jgi:hypothetical protein